MSNHTSTKPTGKLQVLTGRVIIAICWILLISVIVIALLVLLSALPAFSGLEPGFSAVFKTFDLTISDVRMILLFTLVFPVILKSLQNSIFKPFLRLIEAREAATLGAAQMIQDLRQQHDDLRQQLESKLAATRLTALQKKGERLKEVRQQASQKVLAAENSAKATVSAEREKIKLEFQTLQEGLVAQNSSLAEALVEKIRKVNG